MYADRVGEIAGRREGVSGVSLGPLDRLDPRSRILGAALMAVSISFADTFYGLLPALPVSLALASAGFVRGGRLFRRQLLRINFAGLFVCLLLPLTYFSADADGKLFGFLSRGGLRLALLILCKLNLVSALFLTLVVPLGTGEVDRALRSLGVPEKFRILLLLTTRQIFVLKDRIAAAVRAVSLRSVGAGTALRLRAWANMLGTTMVHASDRAERSAMAMKSRGGFQGFGQHRAAAWRCADTLFCLVCLTSGAATVLLAFFARGW